MRNQSPVCLSSQTTLRYVRFLLVAKILFIAILSKLAPVKVALSSKLCSLADLHPRFASLQRRVCPTMEGSDPSLHCPNVNVVFCFFLQMVHFFSYAARVFEHWHICHQAG